MTARLTISSVVFLLCGFSLVAEAAVTNLTNPGTGPYVTIQAALDNAATVAGDVIVVDAGTYDEAVTIIKAVTLKGANAGKDPLDFTRGAESIIRNNNVRTNFKIGPVTSGTVTVDGFKIIPDQTATAPVRSRGVYDNGINSASATAVIRNNIISAYWDNGIRVTSGTATITNNSIVGRGVQGDYSGDGVRVDAGSATIANNELGGNQYNGAAGAGSACGLSLNAAATVDADNNLIHDNILGVHIKGIAGSHLPLATVNNCSIYSSTTLNFYYEVTGGGSPSSPYDAACNWWGSTDDPTITASISGSATHLSFLASGTDADLVTSGFQPGVGTCTGVPVELSHFSID